MAEGRLLLFALQEHSSSYHRIETVVNIPSVITTIFVSTLSYTNMTFDPFLANYAEYPQACVRILGHSIPFDHLTPNVIICIL